MKKIEGVIAILLFIAASSTVYAQTASWKNRSNQTKHLSRETEINMEAAAKVALKRVSGIIEMRKRDDRRRIFSFEIRDALGKINTVEVSQIDGQIISVKQLTDENDDSLLSAAAAEQTRQNSDDKNDKIPFIVPTNPTASNPAEFQRPGVLQIAYGYDSNFRAKDTPSEQSAPLKLRFAASRRLLLEFDLVSVISQTAPDKTRATGVGSTQLGIQYVVQHQSESAPGIALAYYVKLPTADSSKDLGTGRVDHNFIGLISKDIGSVTVDFNAIYLLAGRSERNGDTSSGQAALAFSRDFTKRVNGTAEISGSSRNDNSSGVIFALGGVSYKVNRRFSLYSGARFGLTPDAPRVGILFGLTAGVANLYKKKD